MNPIFQWIGAAAATAFVIGGNLWFYYMFGSLPAEKEISDGDYSELGEDPK